MTKRFKPLEKSQGLPETAWPGKPDRAGLAAAGHGKMT